jgi:hypothetical protein
MKCLFRWLLSNRSLRDGRFFLHWLWQGRSRRQVRAILWVSAALLFSAFITYPGLRDVAAQGISRASLPNLLFFLIPLLFIPLCFYAIETRERNVINAIKKKAHVQLGELNVPSADSRFSFVGTEATIVHEELVRLPRRRFRFMIIIYAKNPADEYFLIEIYQDDKPFFKHVNKRMAAIVLKGKELVPSEVEM